ncbi:popeye domain-containing protein 3-like isoform X1 [Parasteatoda tepidariorum]|uniref:popeye domain-containing protein 3-like isoform X1 n=1 Tax=Parasteatoda tepidariorum TaxID=114398 RepID=UPI001C726759|nr:popeye domain-containing protein 3-like [Parasteatoda tepidariorum]
MDGNVTWSNVTFLNYMNVTLINPCMPEQKQPQHVMYQLANICFIISYLAPGGEKGLLFMHSSLIIGFFIFAMWAWNVVCSPSMFSWNFLFVLMNMGQLLHILYNMRKVKFNPELEDVYRHMFLPLQVSRHSFKKLVCPDYSQVMSLHPGEAYAMQNLTKTDRLGLLISGKVNVVSGQHFLHYIQAREFLDSPEFESSRSGVEEKFKVSIIATTPSRCIVWQRQSLEYLLIKETHLSTVLALLLSRDITRKLYAMNEKMVTEKGSHLDIRLPSFTGSIASQEDTKKVTESTVFGSKDFVATGHGHTRVLHSE